MKAVRFLPYPLPLVFACMLLASAKLEAQLSFASAIDLALRNSPRVKMAEADAAKAKWDQLSASDKQALRKSAWQKRRAELTGMEAVGQRDDSYVFPY